MPISACSQVRGRTSVGYGENSTTLHITLSDEGEIGKNVYNSLNSQSTPLLVSSL